MSDRKNDKRAAQRAARHLTQLGIRYQKALQVIDRDPKVQWLRIDELPVKHRQALIFNLGLDGRRPGSLEDIAVKFGWTRERARTVRDEALTLLGADPSSPLIAGSESDLAAHIADQCPRCNGSGEDPDEPGEECERCDGDGTITAYSTDLYLLFGKATRDPRCPNCNSPDLNPKANFGTENVPGHEIGLPQVSGVDFSVDTYQCENCDEPRFTMLGPWVPCEG